MEQKDKNILNKIITFLSTSLSESLADELEDTSSFDLGILKEKKKVVKK